MTMNITWLEIFTPLFVAIVAYIILFLSLQKLKIPGSSTTHAILSLIIALIFAASASLTEYTTKIIPWFAVFAVIIFLFLVLLAFIDIDFKKTIAWMVFIILIIILIFIAVDIFPNFYHMFPNTSDAYLTTPQKDFKEFLYHEESVHNIIFIGIMIALTVFLIKKA